MSLYYISRVTDRAKLSFDCSVLKYSPKPLFNQEWKNWVDHWFKTADEIRQEYFDEGLLLTVEEHDKEIELQKRWIYK